MKSFKSFMLDQRDECTPEVFKRRYDDYQMQHALNFCRHFFDFNKEMDWFRERYDPLKRQEQVEDTINWAAAESSEFKRCVERDSENMLQSCSFDATAKEVMGSTPEIFLGKHLSGHAGNTLCISGIPANCSKQSLRSALSEVIPEFSRLVVAQPQWVGGSVPRFERTAWVVMPSAQAANEAITLLYNYQVKVLGPTNLETGEQPTVSVFTLQTKLHVPRDRVTLPPDLSTPARIAYDTDRALDLSRLLDEARRIPEMNRISEIIELYKTSSNLTLSPTNKLDLVLAYLRRVHLVSYYSGKRFRDEAHLLSLEPDVELRSAAQREGEHGFVDHRIAETDRQIDEILRAAGDEVMNRRAATNDPQYNPTSDERDAKLIAERSDEILEEWVQMNLRLELEGKARCCFKWCNKLFKGPDFLHKHLKSKHAMEVNAARLLAVSEPFMWARYESEDVSARPLPPIEIETSSGVELVSVQSIFDNLSRPMIPELPPQIPHIIPPFDARHKRGFIEEPRRQRGIPQATERRQSFTGPSPARSIENPRPLVKYDIDTPKVSFVPICDYSC